MKRLKLMAVMLIVALTFSGCVKLDMNTVINADGSGVFSITTDIEKEKYLDAVRTMVLGKEMTDEELEGFVSEEGTTTVMIDGKEYYRSVDTVKAKAGELSSFFAMEDKDIISYVDGDTLYIKVIPEGMFSGYTGANMEGEDLSSCSLTMTFEFATPIVSTNGVIDATNPNKVTFTIPPTVSEYDIFATTNSTVTVDKIKAKVSKLNRIGVTKIKKLKVNDSKKTAKKTSATINIKKAKQADYYEIQCSLKKNFKNPDIYTTKKLTYKIKKLKKGKKYYVRVRACKENYAGQMVYSKWSKKTLKVDKS